MQRSGETKTERAAPVICIIPAPITHHLPVPLRYPCSHLLPRYSPPQPEVIRATTVHSSLEHHPHACMHLHRCLEHKHIRLMVINTTPRPICGQKSTLSLSLTERSPARITSYHTHTPEADPEAVTGKVKVCVSDGISPPAARSSQRHNSKLAVRGGYLAPSRRVTQHGVSQSVSIAFPAHA